MNKQEKQDLIKIIIETIQELQSNGESTDFLQYVLNNIKNND